MPADDRRIGAEIEHAAHALDDDEQEARIGKADVQAERRAGVEARDFDRTAAAVDRNRAPIARLGDRFDAGRRARAEKRQHGVPVVRRAIGEPEAIAICIRLGGRSLPGETPQLCRRACVRAANLGVESPKASEAGRDRDLMEREARLVDELLGEMRASGKGDVERRRAEVLQEQAPQVSRGDAEPIRK